MKSIGVLLVFITACWGYEDLCHGTYARAIYEKCLLENGDDRVTIYDFIHFKKSRNDHGKCFRACIFRECQYFDQHGIFDPKLPQRLGEHLNGGDEANTPILEKIVTYCMTSPHYQGTLCDIAETLTACVADHYQTGFKINDVFD